MAHDHRESTHHDHRAAEQPGIKQEELHEAAQEGPHGSHAAGHISPAEEGHAEHTGHGGHHEHHAMMVEDFRRRFWVSLVATLPILALSPMIQSWLGLMETLSFPGDVWVLFGLSTFVYVYGGWPFLTGFIDELEDRKH